MSQLETFVNSARERAEQKGMPVEVYLARQIELSARALYRVGRQEAENNPEQVALKFDCAELTSASRRLQNTLEMEYES